MDLSMILDGVMIVLLATTIIYAFVLNRRLGSLRSEKEGLEVFIEKLGEATRRAEGSLGGMREAAEQYQTAVRDSTARAEALRDELAFLVDRADGSAERLAERSSRGPDAETGQSNAGQSESGNSGSGAGPAANAAKPKRPARRAPATPASEVEPDGNAQQSDAERDLLRALRDAR